MSSAVSAAENRGAAVTVHYGRVIDQAPADLRSEAGRGALIGGLAGLASASGGTRTQRWRNTVIGAGVGGAVSGSAEGSLQGMAYTVETAAGSSIRIVSDQGDIRVGDCVAVEKAGDSGNIRRVADALCEAPGAAAEDEVIVEELEEEAAECAEAKRQLLEAETDADIDRAVLRVQVLCED
jgi:hypothetical protein